MLGPGHYLPIGLRKDLIFQFFSFLKKYFSDILRFSIFCLFWPILGPKSLTILNNWKGVIIYDLTFNFYWKATFFFIFWVNFKIFTFRGGFWQFWPKWATFEKSCNSWGLLGTPKWSPSFFYITTPFNSLQPGSLGKKNEFWNSSTPYFLIAQVKNNAQSH